MWRERIHWAWVPTALFFTVAIWLRNGWLPAVLVFLGGIGLGLFVRWRHRND